ncbi:hypothetical protein AOQ84DRAFT_82899 [Glonium stellatum]|uniref:DUF3433 domain containing protein n=1 Tax=Glonium stellatum TaxID=574774 RepID=A0A8E2EX55_9PEZI|nr:hypothetical protein AOQ84DRAFT_82899 [Glonium stellatum]
MDQLPTYYQRRTLWSKIRNVSRFATVKRTGSGDINCSSWKPTALRTPVLVFAIISSWLLIVILQLLLAKSRRDRGIFFAVDTNNIPLSNSFLYLYLPTVIAVIYSIFWSWIDIETKRLEPYYQLSKPGGSLGKDSLLLRYPFDFLPFVPVNAITSGHWPVFWASTAIVIVAWGLVPFQAGIFATDTVTKSITEPALVSTSFMPLDQQQSNMTTGYIQSVFGITWLNETLPPYMALEYALAPFKLQAQSNTQLSETWTATTQLFGLDVTCETAKRETLQSGDYYLSSNGCLFGADLEATGNDTIGGTGLSQIKEFSALYAGYWNQDGFADYYLSDMSPPEANHTFFASFTRNKKSAADPPNNVTALFCQPNYYMQDVNATVTLPLLHPISAVPIGPKRPLPQGMYNTSQLEWQMNSAVQRVQARGEVPGREWVSQIERLSGMNITQQMDGQELPYMAAFAIGAYPRPLEEYLDPAILGKSYEAAYRLIFARSMVDVLNQSFITTISRPGQRQYQTQAIILVPAFTFLVEGLLGVVSVFAIILLYLSVTRPRQLRSDPGTIAAVMSLVADNSQLLQDFESLDCSTEQEIDVAMRERKFCLEFDGQRSVIKRVEDIPQPASGDTQPNSSTQNAYSPGVVRSKGIPKPIRPFEFRLLMAIPFIVFQLVLAATLAFLFVKSKPYGLPLPSYNRIVRQLLENYIPTAIATFIEPIWVVINRLLCMLQPLEKLRGGKASSRQSITIDYSSLPPQLVIWKAIRSTHFVLAAVCGMALLANLLAVALSSLFFEGSMGISYPTTFSQPFAAKFVSINGSVGPASIYEGIDALSGAYQGGRGMDQFYIAESNVSTGTPLPVWTDNKFMYIPFSGQAKPNTTQGFLGRTRAFGAQMDCTQLMPGAASHYTAAVWIDPHSGSSSANFSMTMDLGTGKPVTCNRIGVSVLKGSITGGSTGGNNYLCQTGPSAIEFVLRLEGLQNATQPEKDLCAQAVLLGWGRDPGPDICARNTTKYFDGTNSLFIGCRPRLVAGLADVLVDPSGYVQEIRSLNISDDPMQQFFSNNQSNLLMQAHQYLFYNPHNLIETSGASWHSDSFPSDFINYLLLHTTNSSHLLDPTLPPPSFNDVSASFNDVYSRLFAIWLGTNKGQLLIPSQKPTEASLSGWMINQETRVFVSKPMFIIAEAVLATYVIVSCLVYIRRPGRYLARLPTSIASIIALFAASSAVQDLKDTAHMSKNERDRYLKRLDLRYGYGSFVGMDGKVHIGIEKQPFVRTIPIPGLVKRKLWGSEKRSDSQDSLS